MNERITMTATLGLVLSLIGTAEAGEQAVEHRLILVYPGKDGQVLEKGFHEQIQLGPSGKLTFTDASGEEVEGSEWQSGRRWAKCLRSPIPLGDYEVKIEGIEDMSSNRLPEPFAKPFYAQTVTFRVKWRRSVNINWRTWFSELPS